MTLSDTHILIVDDDQRLRKLLGKYLRDQGWHVTEAEDAADARIKLAVFSFDVMVLDVMMPRETGVDFAKSLRSEALSFPPILMLTAMGEAQDRIAGLEAGVDDYLAKPFEPRELVLRIQTILRRMQSQKQEQEALHFGVFSFDIDSARLTKSGEDIYLTESEAALLQSLADASGTSVSREQLASMSGGTISSERSVDVQINRLRKKIEQDPSRPSYIQTVRGSGYMLRVGL